MYQQLHVLFNRLKRYSFQDIKQLEHVNNGIYLLFEKGEKYESLDRVVRVGSHPSQNRFYARLKDHFMDNHRKSIVRKHIGRCFLNDENDPYISVWDFSNTQVKKGSPGNKLINEEKEKNINRRISDYLNNFSICVIPELNNDIQRMTLESKLITTLNLTDKNYISPNWLGKKHPNHKIAHSGLWNIQKLNDNNFISTNDFELIQLKTKNEYTENSF